MEKEFCYKEMYFRLFAVMSEIIESIQKIQKEVEENYMTADGEEA